MKKIYIEITNVCNLNCKFCPTSKRKQEFMSVNNFENIIKKICKHTNLVCLHVKGEPLLHPELENILKILEKYNLKTNITTNGTLLKEKIGILKNSSSVRQINVSLHSIVQNDCIDFKKYLNDIFESVLALYDIIISYRLWNLKDLGDNNINQKIIEHLESYYDLKNLKACLENSKFFKIRDNIFINQDLEFVWPSSNGKIINDSGRCLALKEHIAILVDGTVVPCCLDNDGEIVLGNILTENIEDILDSSFSKRIKEGFKKGVLECKLCKTCGFLKRLESKRK